jgi:hypothetical protein
MALRLEQATCAGDVHQRLQTYNRRRLSFCAGVVVTKLKWWADVRVNVIPGYETGASETGDPEGKRHTGPASVWAVRARAGLRCGGASFTLCVHV